MIKFDSIKSIDAVWSDDGSSYVYKALPETISGNEQAGSIRFKLREMDGQDDDLEIVIQKRANGSYIFKTDYYERPEHEYPLKTFAAEDELIFHFHGKEGVAYFHLAA